MTNPAHLHAKSEDRRSSAGASWDPKRLKKSLSRKSLITH
jgi:hypothetical protein